MFCIHLEAEPYLKVKLAITKEMKGNKKMLNIRKENTPIQPELQHPRYPPNA